MEQIEGGEGGKCLSAECKDVQWWRLPVLLHGEICFLHDSSLAPSAWMRGRHGHPVSKSDRPSGTSGAGMDEEVPRIGAPCVRKWSVAGILPMKDAFLFCTMRVGNEAWLYASH